MAKRSRDFPSTLESELKSYRGDFSYGTLSSVCPMPAFRYTSLTPNGCPPPAADPIKMMLAAAKQRGSGLAGTRR